MVIKFLGGPLHDKLKSFSETRQQLMIPELRPYFGGIVSEALPMKAMTTVHVYTNLGLLATAERYLASEVYLYMYIGRKEVDNLRYLCHNGHGG